MSTKTFDLDVMCQLLRFDAQSNNLDLDPWI